MGVCVCVRASVHAHSRFVIYGMFYMSILVNFVTLLFRFLFSFRIMNRWDFFFQVFFARLILADMNKEIKGLRFVTLSYIICQSDERGIEVYCFT